MKPLALFVIVSSLAFAAVPGARASEVVVFGDSWAESAAGELTAVFAAHGLDTLDVYEAGTPGTTAEHWAVDEPLALPDAVSLNVDAQWVWLSVGGNDVFERYLAAEGATASADNETHISALVDGLLASDPNIRIVMFGYDFPNFEKSAACQTLKQNIFKQRTTAQINQVLLDDVGAVQSAIAANRDRVTYVGSVWGALQVAGGVEGAPDPSQPSPAQYISSDCIQPTAEGYGLVMEALFDAYWGQPAPTAAIDAPQTEFCAGEGGSFADTSADAAQIWWTVDGEAAGTEATLDLELAEPGTFTIGLRAENAAWTDSTEVEVVVHPLPAPDAGADRSICQGESAQLEASGGDAFAWTPTSGLTTPNEGTTDAAPDETTTYELTARNGFGCTATDTVTISVDPLPALELSGATEVLVDDAETYLAAGDPGTVAWTVTGGEVVGATDTQVTVRWTTVGEGSVEAEKVSAEGCTTLRTLAVTVGEPGPEVVEAADAGETDADAATAESSDAGEADLGPTNPDGDQGEADSTGGGGGGGGKSGCAGGRTTRGGGALLLALTLLLLAVRRRPAGRSCVAP